MMRATLQDAPVVAKIINDPSVRPYLGDGGGDDVDPSELIADDKNVLLFDEGGGQFFHWRGPGVFEAHSFYLVRGRPAIERGKQAVRLMFEQFGAEQIWRAPLMSNRAARWFNRQLGFRSLGPIATDLGECELFDMRRAECH